MGWNGGERGVEGGMQSNRTRNQSREAGSTWLREGGKADRQTAGGRAEGTVPSRARDTGRRALETRHWAVCPGAKELVDSVLGRLACAAVVLNG